MSFWKFCEKVSEFVGEELVLTYIRSVREKWAANQTVDQVVDSIRESEVTWDSYFRSATLGAKAYGIGENHED